jgi:hypothetical protein
MPANSKLFAAFLASGRSRDELERRLANSQPLSDYEIDLLKAGEIQVDKNRRFFDLAKALLPPAKFVGLLSEAKGDALEGRAATKNPTARLIWRIKEAVAEPIRETGLNNGAQLRRLLEQRSKG